LKRIFSEAMPVRSFSFVSIASRIVLESRAIVRRASSSASTPFLMAPPSRKFAGGLASSVAAMRATTAGMGSSRARVD